VTVDRPYFEVAVKGPIPTFYDLDKESKYVAFENFLYKHHNGLRGFFELDFWLPENETVYGALEKVFQSYIDVSK